MISKRAGKRPGPSPSTSISTGSGPIGVAVTVVEGAGPALIASNMITGARQGAVVGHRWKEATTGDLTREDAASRFPHLSVSGNVVR